MDTKRRDLLALLGASLAAPRVSLAQPQGKLRRIGVLCARSRPTPQKPDAYFGTFVRAMKELGYVEGKNLAIEWRYADGKYERLAGLAAELVHERVEVIVTHLSEGALAAYDATKTIPIVSVSLPGLGTGFAKSLAHPGGNVTGLSLIAADIYPKQIEMLRIMLPGAKRVGILFNPGNRTRQATLKNVDEAAQRFGISLVVAGARTPAEAEQSLATMVRQRADAVIVFADGVFIGFRRQLVEMTLKYRLPSVFYYREDTQAGALMSYGQNIPAFYRLTAGYVAKILNGAKPGDLPIEQPSKLHLSINRKTAKALGVVVPQDLLLRADELID